MSRGGFGGGFSQGIVDGGRLSNVIATNRNRSGIRKAGKIMAEMEAYDPMGNQGAVPDGSATGSYEDMKDRYAKAMGRITDPTQLDAMDARLEEFEKGKVLDYATMAHGAMLNGDSETASKYINGVSAFMDPAGESQLKMTPDGRGVSMIGQDGRGMIMNPQNMMDMVHMYTNFEDYRGLMHKRKQLSALNAHRSATRAAKNLVEEGKETRAIQKHNALMTGYELDNRQKGVDLDLSAATYRDKVQKSAADTLEAQLGNIKTSQAIDIAAQGAKSDLEAHRSLMTTAEKDRSIKDSKTIADTLADIVKNPLDITKFLMEQDDDDDDDGGSGVPDFGAAQGGGGGGAIDVPQTEEEKWSDINTSEQNVTAQSTANNAMDAEAAQANRARLMQESPGIETTMLTIAEGIMAAEGNEYSPQMAARLAYDALFGGNGFGIDDFDGQGSPMLVIPGEGNRPPAYIRLEDGHGRTAAVMFSILMQQDAFGTNPAGEGGTPAPEYQSTNERVRARTEPQQEAIPTE